MQDYIYLKWQKANQVCKLDLNRSEVMNAFNEGMIAELTHFFSVFLKASENRDVRAVVMSGAGKNFCAGADLSYMKKMAQYSLTENKQDADKLLAMYLAIKNCHLPLLVRVQGAAFGGALGLIACADLALADTAAQFCFSEVKLGLAPAVISGFVLDKCQVSLARLFMLSGRVFTAQDALNLGLVHQLVEGREEMEQETLAWVRTFLNAAPYAFTATKKLLSKWPGSLTEAYQDEGAELISTLRVGLEGQEGLSAFFAKKKPSWQL